MKELLKNGVTHPITSCLAALVLVILSWHWRNNIHFEADDPTNWIVPLLGVATTLSILGVVFTHGLNSVVGKLVRLGCGRSSAAEVLGEEARKEHVPAIVGLLLLGLLTANLPGVREVTHHILETSIPLPKRVTFHLGMEVITVLAVVLMLHRSALETQLKTMVEYLGWAMLVAILGVIVPGWLYYKFIMVYAPDTPFVEAMGWGILIVATSMGIANLILTKMGVIKSKTGQLILAVAAIDDILALAALTAWQSATSSHGNVAMSAVALLLVKNLVFMGLAFISGAGLAPGITRFMSRYAHSEKALAVLMSLTSSFAFGVMAQCWGLSPLAGVYAGGAFLTEVMFEEYSSHSKHKLEDLLEPFGAIVLPIFFIMIGRRVSVAVLSDPHTWIMAGAGAMCLLVGKLVSVAMLPKSVDRRTAFWGLLPRGEVLLVIAAMVSRAMTPQQATVIMVVAVLLIMGSMIAGAIGVPKAVARALARNPNIFRSVAANDNAAAEQRAA